MDDLWQCLSDPLCMEVTSEQGASLEADLTKAINRMSVLKSNRMVHRNNMRQTERSCHELHIHSQVWRRNV